MKTLKTWLIDKLTARKARDAARSEFLVKLDACIAELNAKPGERIITKLKHKDFQ